MECQRQGRGGHVAFDRLPAGRLLLRFPGDGLRSHGAVGERGEPFFGKVEHALLVEVGRDGQDGVRRVVVGAVEGLYVVECRSGDVVGREPDGRPAVGVDFVGQCPQQHRLVAVGLVEVALAELLDHHAFLRLEFSGVMSSPSMRSLSSHSAVSMLSFGRVM